MMRLSAAIGLILLAGCSKPDMVLIFPSPAEGLFYTVEEYRAGGPVSDTVRVVAHLERNGASDSMLVLDGGDITVKAVRWDSQNEVTICIEGGITNTFRNQVTLFAEQLSVTIRNRLDERCGNGDPL